MMRYQYPSAWRNLIALLVLFVPGSSWGDEPPCSGADLSAAQTAMKVATKAMDHAISIIDHPSQDQVNRMLTWFGAMSSQDAAEVRQTLVSARIYAGSATYLCANSTSATLGDVYAYVRPDKSFVIVLGAFFSSAPEVGFDSKMGTLVHEMTHFVLSGATQDHSYGSESAKALAKIRPSTARKTADNYEYFVESTFFKLRD